MLKLYPQKYIRSHPDWGLNGGHFSRGGSEVVSGWIWLWLLDTELLEGNMGIGEKQMTD